MSKAKSKSLLTPDDDASLAELTEGYADQLEPLSNEINGIPATREEEGAMAIGAHKVMSDIFSDETLPKFANVFHQDERPIHEVVVDLAKPMLLSAKNEIEQQTGEDAPASVFMAEDGLLMQAVAGLFDLAQQLSIPGADDPDMFAAALMGGYKAIGEHVLEEAEASGDMTAMGEAAQLGGELVAKGYGQPDLDSAQSFLQKNMAKSPVPEELQDMSLLT